MASRGTALTVTYYAWDTGNSVGKTGDVANHTLRIVADGTEATPANSPAQVDATNCPGLYKIALTAGECTCDALTLHGKSSTSGIVITPQQFTFEATPAVIAAGLLDLAAGVETGVTVRQALRAIAAGAAGDVTGAGTAAEAFKAIGNSGTTRVTPNADDSGNRTNVTLNL